MSIQSEIDRIEQNIANTYTALSDLGADMPTEQNSDNLAQTVGTAKAVLYIEQTLSDEEQAQARENVGAASQIDLQKLSNEKVDQNQGAENVGKILAVGTDGNLVLVPMPEGGASGDVIGTLDESNNILLTGDLADGTYTIKYEMDDGSVVNVGSLVVSGIVYVTVTNNLTNCTSDNSAAQAVKGESYSATITADSGYELSSVDVTMGGNPVTVSGGVISIAEVTGDIVITAVAEEIKEAEPVTVDITLTDGIRIGSDGTDRTQAGYCATPHIDLKNIPKPCTIHLTKAFWCDANKLSTMVRVNAADASGTKLINDITSQGCGGNYFAVVDNSGGTGNDVTVTVTSVDVATIRFSGWWAKAGVSDSDTNFAGANTKATLTYTPES